MSKRTDMLASSFMRSISNTIQNDIKDPRLGFVTITDVNVSGDARYVTVFVSIMGNYDEIKESMIVLSNSKGLMKNKAKQTIRLRFVPEIIIKLDETAKNAEKMESIILRIKEDKKNQD